MLRCQTRVRVRGARGGAPHRGGRGARRRRLPRCRANKLSGGLRRRLSLAIALIPVLADTSFGCTSLFKAVFNCFRYIFLYFNVFQIFSSGPKPALRACRGMRRRLSLAIALIANPKVPARVDVRRVGGRSFLAILLAVVSH